MTSKIKVEAFEKGPFKVTGVEEFSHCGKAQKADEAIVLCRCGESKNQPFCDGIHREVGFESANELAEVQDLRIWEGEKIKTIFDPNLCMHVFVCKSLKKLRLNEIEEEGTAAAEEIMKVVKTCPSGALRYELKAEIPEVGYEFEHPLEIIEGGEIRINGEFEPFGFELRESHSVPRATLCRCGLSKNKPFCDGRHKQRKGYK